MPEPADRFADTALPEEFRPPKGASYDDHAAAWRDAWAAGKVTGAEAARAAEILSKLRAVDPPHVSLSDVTI